MNFCLLVDMKRSEYLIKPVAVCITVFLFLSCSEYDKDVRMAFRYAGENREELEKVLDYYENIEPDPGLLDAKLNDPHFPETLSNIFVRDVTSEYGRTQDIEIT